MGGVYMRDGEGEKDAEKLLVKSKYNPAAEWKMKIYINYSRPWEV